MATTFKNAQREPGIPPQGGAARLETLLGRLDGLVDWERRDRGVPGRAMRVDLGPVRDLLERLGHPERAFRSVHVAGTKGKGSVAALVAAALARTGGGVGLYTSPHVERVHERIRIDGRAVTDEAFASGLERVFEAREAALREETGGRDATWFDVLTAAAFVVFAEAGVGWAVVECGLGGRLDSTNALVPAVSAVTNIDLEHTAILGSTRAAIASEKAGIAKPGVPLVCGVLPEDEAYAEILRAAEEAGARLVPAGAGAPRPGVSEDGGIAACNARLAGTILDVLGRETGLRIQGEDAGAWLLDDATRSAAALPGRLERCSLGGVPVVLDGAHVPASLAAVLDGLEADSTLKGPPVVVFGCGKDKDAGGLLKVLEGRVDRLLCTSVGAGPYRSPRELLEEARRLGVAADPADDPRVALQRAKECVPSGGWVLVTGSLHLIGALRDLVRDN